MSGHKSEKKGPNIICRVSNVTPEMVCRYVERLPKQKMTEDAFRNYMGKRWFQNEHQAPEQWGLYYIDGTNYYPRFDHDVTIEEADAYLYHWMRNLIVVNPYTRFKKQSDKKLVESIVNQLEKNPNEHDLKTIIRRVIDSDEPFVINEIIANALNNYSMALKVEIINKDEERYNVSLLPNYKELLKSKNNMTKKEYFELFDGVKTAFDPDAPLQQIFYGAPGTGKSHIIKEQTKGEDVIRTTFHPDTDYSTFVGTYKPTTEFAPVLAIIGDKAVETGREEKRISYEFVSQAFLQAYVAAWKKVAEAKGGALKKQFLVIEEINRGNCAQIFGDLFQLLDRNDFGYSDYPIKADADMQKQLKRLFEGVEIENAESINALFDDRDIVKEVLSGEVLLLPNNLYIWATMNTSDQSLFPIDSAFKRRWDWQYMPISEGRDKNGQSKNWKIEADTQMYSWWSFIQKINDEIYDKTNSEDKKLGFYFCKPMNGVIKAETFVSKVLFYLWNDVFKDFDNESGIFAEPYDKFYGTGTRGEVLIAKDKVQTLLDNLHVEVAEIIGADENESASDDSDNATTTGSSARDKSVYSINGEGNYVKKTVPLATVTAYVKNYPDVTASELVETWYALGTMIRQIVISKESYEQKLSKTSDAIFAKRYDSLNLPNGEVVYVYNQFTPERINDFISKVNEQSWDIHIEKVAE